jgi:hypothetical protein
VILGFLASLLSKDMVCFEFLESLREVSQSGKLCASKVFRQVAYNIAFKLTGEMNDALKLAKLSDVCGDECCRVVLCR